MRPRRCGFTSVLLFLIHRLFEVGVLAAIAAAALYVRLYVTPYRRGFFCSDNSIRFPFRRDQTVSPTMLAAGAVVVPVIVIFLAEHLRALARYCRILRPAKFYRETYSLSRCCQLPASITQSYKYIGYFIIGQATNAVLTLFVKVQLGVLRPHFIDVCQTNMSDICTIFDDADTYKTEYNCSHDRATDVIEARQSFPSGHAAIAFYAAVYLIVYMQARLKLTEPSRLLVLILQVGAFAVALYCSLSRITDDWHHASDVWAGAGMGSILAILFLNNIADVFYRRVDEDDDDEEEDVRDDDHEQVVHSIVYRSVA